jgi:hypothetical protein
VLYFSVSSEQMSKNPPLQSTAGTPGARVTQLLRVPQSEKEPSLRMLAAQQLRSVCIRGGRVSIPRAPRSRRRHGLLIHRLFLQSSLNRCAKSPHYRQMSSGRATGSNVLSRETVAAVVRRSPLAPIAPNSALAKYDVAARLLVEQVAVSSASLYWNCSSTVAAQVIWSRMRWPCLLSRRFIARCCRRPGDRL